MDNTRLIIVAMAEQCRSLILKSDPPEVGLPRELQRKHLLWMCNQIEEHAEDGSVTRLHRWIGFVQAAMLANRTVDLERLKTMFDEAKRAHGQSGEDLVDHLDPSSSFELDIGGQG